MASEGSRWLSQRQGMGRFRLPPVPPVPLPALVPQVPQAPDIQPALLISELESGVTQYFGSTVPPVPPTGAPVPPVQDHEAAPGPELPRGGAYLEGTNPLSPPRYFGAPIPSVRASEPEPPAAETPPPVDDWIPRDRKPKRSIDDVVGDVLRLLSNENISFATLVLTVLTNTRADYEPRRSQFYAKKEGNVGQLLDALELDSRGKAAIEVWFRVRALDLVCQDVYKEMEKGKSKLHMQIKDVTSDFLETWDLKRAVESAPAPTLMRVLEAASENRVARAANTNRSPIYVQRIVLLMLHHARSQASSMLQNYLGVYFWAEGCPRRLIEFLSRISLAPSYTSTLKIIEALSASSVARARLAVARIPHAFAYDNFNVSMSEHVEQRPDAPSKVQSGTFGLVYEIPGARWHDVRLQPMTQNLRASTDLTIQDISPSRTELKCFMHQCKIHVVRALVDYISDFSSYATDPGLQHIARHPLPATPTATFHSLGICAVSESSIEGNMVYQQEAYIRQLKYDDGEDSSINENAIPLIADLHTLRCTRSGQRRRPGDVTAWTRREIFQLGPGLFHLLMNLIWAVLSTHRATVSQTGSLTWFFNILDKRRLGREKPDFHTLLVSLQQILSGILLHAWRLECGDLDAFAETQPSADCLLEISERILLKYATPYFALDEIDGSVSHDTVNRNLRLLMRDLFYVVELARATSDGDIGRVEDIFPALARIFRGAGYNNYSTEILYYLHNIKKVWTPRFADIMRQNMIVNVAGLPRHFMGTDMNIEHLIGCIKNHYTSNGVHAHWDRLENIAASVTDLMRVKKHLNKQFGLSYKSIDHKDADTAELVFKAAQHVADSRLLEVDEGRIDNDGMKLTKNLHLVGDTKIATSSLSTFNKKMRAFIDGTGTGIVEEADELEQPQFGAILDVGV